MSRFKKKRVKFDFNSESKSELKVKRGEIVYVFEEGDDGWSLCSRTLKKKNGGFVPSKFLQDVDAKDKGESNVEPKAIVANDIDIERNCEGLKRICEQMKNYIRWTELGEYIRVGKHRKPNQRLNQILETITTEATYVAQLTSCVEQFKIPMVEGNLIDETQGKVLFSNIESIKDCSTMLLELLLKAKEDVAKIRIAGCFIKISPFFKLYKTYINNFDKAGEMLEKLKKKGSVAKFLEKTKRQSKFNLSLEEYLLIPVLRIPRYKLLFDKILKYTPKDHVEYGDLSKAHLLISNVADFVNEAKKERAFHAECFDLHKVLKGRYDTLIQSFRKFQLKTTKLKIMCKEKNLNKLTSFDVYLFSDLVIFLEHESFINLKSPRAALCFLAFCEVFIDEEIENGVILRCLSEGKIVHYQLCFATAEEMQLWSEKIGGNIIDLQRKMRGKITSSLGGKSKSIIEQGVSRGEELVAVEKLGEQYEVEVKKLKAKEEIYEKLSVEIKEIEENLNQIGVSIADLHESKEKTLEEVQLLLQEKEKMKSQVLTLSRELVEEDAKFLNMLSQESNAFYEIFGEPFETEVETKKQEETFKGLEKEVSIES